MLTFLLHLQLPLKTPDDDHFAVFNPDEVVELDCFWTQGGHDFMNATYNIDAFLNAPPGPNPIGYQTIHHAQQQDHVLVNLTHTHPQHYSVQPFGAYQLICYRINLHGDWRIVIPHGLLPHLIDWYHNVLMHPGTERLYRTILRHFYHRHLKEHVETYTRHCRTCQQHKATTVQYGHLPPREANFQPFYEVAVDSIGPWTVNVNGQDIVFKALTMIDTTTNLTELVRTETETTALETAHKFEQCWLYRYPRPVRVIFDAGSEFKAEFRDLLTTWGIAPHPIGVRNPQANAICERMHQTVSNLLRSLLHSHPPHNIADARELVDQCLQVASHALRSTIHRTLGISPGAAVFNRDMFLDIPFIVDYIRLRHQRQQLIDYNLRRENNKRRNWDYVIGGYVYEIIKLRNEITRKLNTYHRGPYRILQVHCNGTLTIQRTPTVTDRLNIRRLRPAL